MMPIKCDVRCDNIVTNNLIDLTSKNPILIKEKITPIENIQNNNNIKDNVIGPSSKNIPHHAFNLKKTNMGCDFFDKNVLKLFNEINKNEEHLNNFSN
jgi:SUMO ligase MMS21 Smc5/6 complex component